MAKKQASRKTDATFEVRLVAPDMSPDKIPLRTVNDVLSAVQDLASGRDSFVSAQVAPEKSIGLVDVRKGSAVYVCISRSPDEALANLGRIAALLEGQQDSETSDDGLVAAFRPIQMLSDVARIIGCRIEVALAGKRTNPLFVVTGEDSQRVSERLLLSGETTILGQVERAGGATEMRCLLRVPGRHRILYCDVATKELVRKLGQHLYENIAAVGTAVWIHRSWYVYKFKITSFTQPRLGDTTEALQELRKAGLNAWDDIPDPEALIGEYRQ